MRIDWSPEAVAQASRFLDDPVGLAEVMAAIDALADDPTPPTAFVRGEYRRLTIGPYRAAYALDGDVITIERVDRVL